MVETILIVGGCGNIGSSLVQHYVDQKRKDAKLLLADKDFVATKRLAMKINDSCGYKLVHPYKVDITAPGSIRGLVRNISADHGSLTHLTNIVGGIVPGEINPEKEFYWFEEGQPSDEAIDYSLQFNLAGSIRLIRDFLPLLEQDTNSNKSITLVSSINALQNWAGPTYSAAKAGLMGLVNSSVSYLGGRGVRINSILFGSMSTPRTDIQQPEETLSLMKASSALGKFVTLEEASKEIYLLAHERTPITGANFVVDCGESKTTCFSQEHTGGFSPED